MAREAAPEVLDYLESRENPNGENVYHRRLLKLRLASGQEVRGITYVADRAHPAYCRPCEQSTAATIARGAGKTGTNREYLENTARQLASMGLADPRLERLMRLIMARPD